MSIRENLDKLSLRIDAACAACGRDPAEITLIGVSKTKPAADVNAAAELGIRDFGENYVEEAVAKMAAIDAPGLSWHFIGRVQSNKTRALAEHFDWVHTVERGKIARRLDSQRAGREPLSVLIQVNADDDPNKAGIAPDAALALAQEIATLEHLRLRGLMTILSQETEPGSGYQSVAQLFHQIGAALEPIHRGRWDTLSMGMTADFEQAIAAGATHIRVGTALFGARNT